MANIYVRSTDGSDADNGSTWALAKATLTGAAAIDAAGDTIWVSQAHAEANTVAITFTWAGTQAAPVRILCGNDAAAPPTALATTGTISTDGDNDHITLSTAGARTYYYGLTFNSGTASAATANIIINNSTAHTKCESCNFNIAATGSASIISCAANASARTELINCGFQFSHADQGITLGSSGTIVRIIGGSILADTAVNNFCNSMAIGSQLMIEGFDFTNGAAGMNIAASSSVGVRVFVRNCKMPASWSGSVTGSTPGVGAIFELMNCDSADTNYRLERKTQFGTVTHETTLIKTGGASDGTTGISWKMVSGADAEWNHQTLDSPEIVKWNETTASAITVTVDILHDSLTNVTNQNIWLEVQYLGTSGTPLALFVDDAAADYITAAADQTDSSSTWTTTGLTNPNTQQLNVTFTPQEKGFIHAVVRLAVASKTVYIDPELVVT